MYLTILSPLKENETSSLGVSIAGGVDNPHVPDSTGIFVTKLVPGTPAEADARLQ